MSKAAAETQAGVQQEECDFWDAWEGWENDDGGATLVISTHGIAKITGFQNPKFSQ